MNQLFNKFNILLKNTFLLEKCRKFERILQKYLIFSKVFKKFQNFNFLVTINPEKFPMNAIITLEISQTDSTKITFVPENIGNGLKMLENFDENRL